MLYRICGQTVGLLYANVPSQHYLASGSLCTKPSYCYLLCYKHYKVFCFVLLFWYSQKLLSFPCSHFQLPNCQQLGEDTQKTSPKLKPSVIDL